MPLRPRHSARGAARSGLWRHWTLWIYFPVAVLLVLAGAFLWRSGHWLVASDPFTKVRWAVVLAGEGRDAERSEEALKLYMDGRIDTLIYSATRVFKDRYASEFMTDWLSRQGYPREKLFEFRQDAYSTQEEAALLIRQFRWQNLDTVVIITANFHTARTKRIFAKLSQGYPHVLVHAADFRDFEPGSWWSSREGRKYWLTEWTKTVSTWFELANASAETGKSETNGLVGGAWGHSSSPLPLPARTPSDSAVAPNPDSAAASDSQILTQDSADALPAPLSPSPSDSGRSALEDSAAKLVKASKPDKPEPAKDTSVKSGEALAAREPAAKEPPKEPAKAAVKSSAKETPAKSTAKESSTKDSKTAKTPAKSDPSKTTAKKPTEKEKAADKEKEKAKKKPAR